MSKVCEVCKGPNDTLYGSPVCVECCEHDRDPDEGYCCLNCGDCEGAADHLGGLIDDAMDRMRDG